MFFSLESLGTERKLRRTTGFFFGLLAALYVFLLPLSASARYASVVIDTMTGQVLHEVNADTRNYPASLTKMMTLYLTFEALESGRLTLSKRLKVSRRASRMPASRLGLRRGEYIRVEDAILALVTKSANDVAVVVAETLGGSETKFARLMSRKAQALGMTRTSFRNASGLPNRRQLSTARDMATLALALIEDFPDYYQYFSTADFHYRGRRHDNHNGLLANYEGTDGIKTGYTRASGYNLVASSVRDGRRLIAVVLGGKTSRARDRQVAQLLDKGFASPLPLRAPRPKAKPARLLAIESDRGQEAAEPTRAANVIDLDDPTNQKSAEDDGAVNLRFVSVAGARIVPLPETKPAELAAVTLPKLDPVEDKAAVEPAAGPLGWGVQVGAFYQLKPAKRVAAKAAKRFPTLLGGAKVAIQEVRGRKGALYRARLLGLSEGDARRACKRMKSARMDCLVVKPDSGVNLALSLKGG